MTVEGYSVANLADFIGTEFKSPAPMQVDQTRIDTFANSTGDTQWIHVDVERAKAKSPFGGPIAHGFLTLSLLATDIQNAGIIPKDAKAALNYGLGKVRFLTPVAAGSSVSASHVLGAVEDKGAGRNLITIQSTLVDVDSGKPAVIAELLAMVVI